MNLNGFMKDFTQMLNNIQPIEINGLTTFITQSVVSDKAVEQAIAAMQVLRPREGKTGTGIDKSKKDSLDLTLPPNHCMLIQNEILEIGAQYVEYYNLHGIVPPLAVTEHFNVQKYPLKGAFHRIHADRGYGPHEHSLRELVWMTYLNDVHTGGETEFMFYKLKIKPQRGLTLLWPAGWTHLHRGLPSATTEKMIITGWLTPIPIETPLESR